MRSKTSFFNTVLFQKNLTRFWPIWGFYFLILILQMPINLFKQAALVSSNPAIDYTSINALADVLQTGLTVIPICIFSLLSAAAVFSYLYSAKCCYMMHGLPLKRKELFLTNYLSGILFLAVPQILTFLLSIIVSIVRNITHVEYLFTWLLLTLGMTFFLYTLSVFCCMLSGHLGGVFVFYIIAAFAFQCARFFLNTIISQICYGLSGYENNVFFPSDTDSFFSYLTPLYHLSSRVSAEFDPDNATIVFNGKTDILIYCGIALILLVLCYMLYKYRQLETVGDIVAIHWLVPVFRWAVALFGGLCFGTIVTEIICSEHTYYFMTLLITTGLFTLVFFYFAEMLLEKRFKIFRKKQIPQFVTCIAIMLMLLCSLKCDWFRIEEYIPETDLISSVLVNGNNTSACDIISDDPDVIRQVTDIQAAIIHRKSAYKKYFDSTDHWKEYYDDSNHSKKETATAVQIEYYLKDGTKIQRSYILPVNEEVLSDASTPTFMLAKLQDNPEWYLQYNLCRNYKETSILGGSIELFDANGNTRTVNLSEENAKKIWDAYQRDSQEKHLSLSLNEPPLTDSTRYYNTLSLYLYSANGFQDIYDLIPQENRDTYGLFGKTFSSSEKSPSVSSSGSSSTTSTTYTGYLPLNVHCSYTLQVIQDLGITDKNARLITFSEYYHMIGIDE